MPHFDGITIERCDGATIRISRSTGEPFEHCEVCEQQIEPGRIMLAYTQTDGLTERCHAGGCASEFYDPGDTSHEIGLEKTLIANILGVLKEDLR